MNITKENIDDLNAVLKVHITPEDYEGKVQDVVNDYRKKARIDGFRAGKVPEGLIRKMYGKAILVEEVNKLISQSLNNYITEEKLNLLGEPLPNENQKQIDFDNEKEFDLAFDIAVGPEIEIKLSRRDKIVYYNIKADQKLIDAQKDNYARRFGSFVEVEEAEDKDMLKGDFVQTDENGNPLEDGIQTEGVTVSLEIMKDEDIKKEILTKKAGDTYNFDVKKAYPNDTEISSMLRIEKDQVADMAPHFDFKIKTIERFQPAEINQELFDKAFGEGEVNSEEELEAKIVEELQENLNKEADYRFLFDTKKKLVKKFDPALPVEFLKRWLKASNENLTDEQIENEFDAFTEDLKWQLIKDQIIREQEMKVEEQEVIDMAKEVTMAQFRQYGLANLPDEQLEQYAREILKKQEEQRKIVDKILENKVLEFIKETVKLDEQEITTSEFDEIWKKDTQK